MIPRGKLYINYSQLLKGMAYCLSGQKLIEKKLLHNKLVCLSVRTGFDLILQALKFPPGSEMLVIDINIPDMFSIINHHGINIVPLTVDKHTLNISPNDVKAEITSNTRAILITHLFGGVANTVDIINMARQHNLMVFEDCAQAYAGNVYEGNSASDVVMFSFGLIKTNTAGSGAVIAIKNNNLLEKVNAIHAQYPVQPTSVYFKKLIKITFMKMLTKRSVYTFFYNLVVAAGEDFEKVIGSFTKGFPGDNVIEKIRYRICYGNERLLLQKLEDFSQETIAERMVLRNNVLNKVVNKSLIGNLNEKHTHWVIPIEVEHPERIIEVLRKNGFDASQKASSLMKLPVRNRNLTKNELKLDKLVYLPVYPDMNESDRNRLNKLLIEILP